MKSVRMILVALLFALPLSADETKPIRENPTYESSRQYVSRVFEVRNRDPRALARSLALLGSGFQGATLDVNTDLSTITVRDFPENVATIEEALARLDVPAKPDPGIDVHLWVLVGSTGGKEGGDFPAELGDVVAELRSALRYSSYALMASAIHSTVPGEGIQGSGVAQNELVGFEGPQGMPLIYAYTLRRVGLRRGEERNSFDIEALNFEMKVPIVQGDSTQYVDVGFQTPVTIREGEKVVVGTTTMGDRALVLVVTMGVRE